MCLSDGGDQWFLDKGRLQKLAFFLFWMDGSSYYHRAFSLEMLYSFFNFNVVADENVCYGMIYLANSCNSPFNLLFGVQDVFRIYNLSCLRQIYTSPHKSHRSDSLGRLGMR